MRKIILLVFLCPIMIFAQYNNEVTTEESFEESEMYFQSNYLNPFGIINFDKVSPGLINNPFLNLYVNPANLPDLDTSNAFVYLDFRGDRTEPQIVQNYIYPMYYSNYYYPTYADPRLSTQARTEPEPIFSFGILSYPLKDITNKFMLGGTYQLIQKDEKYYTMPNWIYYPRYGLDAFNVMVSNASSVPVLQQWVTAVDAGCPSGSGTCNYSVSHSLANANYKTYVVGCNAVGYGPWSDPLSFTVNR